MNFEGSGCDIILMFSENYRDMTSIHVVLRYAIDKIIIESIILKSNYLFYVGLKYLVFAWL